MNTGSMISAVKNTRHGGENKFTIFLPIKTEIIMPGTGFI